MTKKVIGMKLEEVEIIELKKKAELNGLTVTDMLMRGLKDADRALYLEEQIKALRAQLKDMQQKTGRKIKTTEYVNVPVTILEKERIRERAHKDRLSNGRYLRACLEGSKSIPELESGIKRLNG